MTSLINSLLYFYEPLDQQFPITIPGIKKRPEQSLQLFTKKIFLRMFMFKIALRTQMRKI